MNGKSGYRLASIMTTTWDEKILIDEGWYAEDNHEYFLRNNSLFTEEIKVSNGKIILNDLPGIGFKLNKKNIKKYQVDFFTI